MTPLSAAELAEMRASQSETMGDTCTIATWHATQDDYGTPINVPVEITGVACGLNLSPTPREAKSASGVYVNVDAVLRLSLVDGAEITEKDSIYITARNGEPFALHFGVTGISRGPTCYVLQLKATK